MPVAVGRSDVSELDGPSTVLGNYIEQPRGRARRHAHA